MAKRIEKLFLPQDLFEKLISDSRFSISKQKNPYKVLNAKALDACLNNHFRKIENVEVKIQHISSRINETVYRKDSKYLVANAKCAMAKSCNVKYAITCKEKNYEHGGIMLTLEITNYHQHSELMIRAIKSRKVTIKSTIKQEHRITREPESEEEEEEEDVTNLEWLDILILVARTCQVTNEYIHDITTFPNFSMILMLNQALEVIHSIDQKYRICVLQNTGNLVKIPKYISSRMGEIFNHFLVCKDSRYLNNSNYEPLLLAELASSGQESFEISKFLNLINYKYEEKYNSKLVFRIIIADYSWEMVNLFIRNYNLNSILDYANSVYDLANCKCKQEFEELASTRTWIKSCNPHTMNKLMKEVKLHIDEREIQEQCINAFSLLVNCLDLDNFEKCLRIISYVFLSETKNHKFMESLEKFEALLIDTDVIKGELSADRDQDESSHEDTDEDSLSHDFQDYNFKASPFYNFSIRIITEIQNELLEIDSSDTVNTLFCDFFIVDILSEMFLPYSFIWSSFVLKNLDADITESLNGKEESIVRQRKSKESYELNVLPARYVINSFTDALNTCASIIL